MKIGVTLAAGVLALGLLASTAEAGGGRGSHSYSGSHHHYGHSRGLATLAGVTGALFGVAVLADALSGPRYVAPPVVYQAPPPVYYYPAPPVYYTRPPVYYRPPTVYYGPAPY